MHTHYHLIRFVLICAGTTLLVGCTHTICLQVVDATTQRPLEGVSIRWLQTRHQMFEALKQEGPTNLPPTGPDGVIKVGGLHQRWDSEFIFSHQGYSNVYGIYEAKSLTLAGQVRYYPAGVLQNQFYLAGGMTTADKSNHCFIVEMQK